MRPQCLHDFWILKPPFKNRNRAPTFRRSYKKGYKISSHNIIVKHVNRTKRTTLTFFQKSNHFDSEHQKILSVDILAKIAYNKFSYNSGGFNMMTVTATDIQNNFGKYLQAAQKGNEIIILKNGSEIARLISKERTVSFLTDSLIGTLKNDYDEQAMRAERNSKYENIG